MTKCVFVGFVSNKDSIRRSTRQIENCYLNKYKDRARCEISHFHKTVWVPRNPTSLLLGTSGCAALPSAALLINDLAHLL